MIEKIPEQYRPYLLGGLIVIPCLVIPSWYLGLFECSKNKKGMLVRDKVVLVTGAGSGIGRALTLELLNRGAKVAAVDLRAETVEETKKIANSANVATFAMDITDAAKVSTLPMEIRGILGEVDAIVNNAGIIQPFIKINELTMETALRVMSVNFDAPLFIIKTFLPGLLTRPQGYILNISSMGAYVPVPGQSVYGASKAALKLLTEGLRSELMETNVGVTIAFPGSIDTNIVKNSNVTVKATSSDVAAKFKGLPAATAAKIMVDAIESGNPRITVGGDATFLDYLCRLCPLYAADLISEQMKSLL